MDLRSSLADFPTRTGPSPWTGWEYVDGYVVHSLPFDSGHVLAVRVLPQNDFAPYVTVWHRTPDRHWSIFVDGPRFDTACPRYFGPATRHVARAHIGVEWTGPAQLHVQVDEPRLDLRLSIGAPYPLRCLNAVHASMPFVLRRSRLYARMMELMARWLLNMSEATMRGIMPSGHLGVVVPRQILFITGAQAVLDGTDLGTPARVQVSPRIGEFALPARPTFAVGGGFWKILDEEEHRRTVSELQADGSSTGGLPGTTYRP